MQPTGSQGHTSHQWLLMGVQACCLPALKPLKPFKPLKTRKTLETFTTRTRGHLPFSLYLSLPLSTGPHNSGVGGTWALAHSILSNPSSLPKTHPPSCPWHTSYHLCDEASCGSYSTIKMKYISHMGIDQTWSNLFIKNGWVEYNKTYISRTLWVDWYPNFDTCPNISIYAYVLKQVQLSTQSRNSG